MIGFATKPGTEVELGDSLVLASELHVIEGHCRLGGLTDESW
jgi:hypothetical protein